MTLSGRHFLASWRLLRLGLGKGSCAVRWDRIRRSFLSQAASARPDINRPVATFFPFPERSRSLLYLYTQSYRGMQPGPASSIERRIAVVSECKNTDRTVQLRARRVAGSSAPGVEVRIHPHSRDAVAHHSAPIRCPTFLPGQPRADPVVDAIARRTSACVSAAAAVTRRALVEWVSPRTSEKPSSKRPRSPRSPIPHPRGNLRGRVNPSRVTQPSESASFPGAASPKASPTRER